MALEVEKATYQAHLDDLRPFKGQWVLIHQTEIVGIYPTWEEATAVADERFEYGRTYTTQIETVTFLEFDIPPDELAVEVAA